MRSYVKRISKKADKLPKEQLLELIDSVVSENDSLYSILESISAGLLIVDNNFVLLQNNSIVESRLPFSVHLDDPKASLVPIWEIIDDEELAEYFQKIAEHEVTNSSEDFTVMTSGGTVRFISVTITPFMRENIVAGRIILIRDVTENKNQEVMLRRMENMSTLTNLAAGMAHEIKNPLGAISIHIQLVQKALKKARENEDILPARKFVEDHIDVVNEEVDHLNKLIMDFLLAVRPVKATLELKNPNKLIKNLISFFEPEFNKNGIKVDLNESAQEVKILLDEKLFRDVILNLAQNSLAAIKAKFSEPHKNEGLFEIDCYVKDNRYIITVKDNGCGMSQETLSKVFEPYYTTKANGTGLGMTTVYKIVKEFSGEISVNSMEGEGTEFILAFPMPQKDTKLLGSKED